MTGDITPVIKFHSKYKKALLTGKKWATTRLGVKAYIGPGPVTLLFDDMTHANAFVFKVEVKDFREIGHTEAVAEGFRSEKQLKEELQSIYLGIEPQQRCTVIYLEGVRP